MQESRRGPGKGRKEIVKEDARDAVSRERAPAVNMAGCSQLAIHRTASEQVTDMVADAGLGRMLGIEKGR